MTRYFDNAATTYLSDRALDEYIRTAREYSANPSSIHRDGQKAKDKLERTREESAELLGIDPRSLFFTSGATESISIFFSSLLWLEPGIILTDKIEHEAVSSYWPILERYGWRIDYLKAKGGFINPEDVKAKLSKDVKVVSVMNTNNVVGAIEPIKEINEIIREKEREYNHRISFFSDSVQALGKTDLDLTLSGVDAASFSAHKINGPRGIGMLYLRNPERLRSIAPAGGQERGKRGGTENLPGIAAMKEALKEWIENREESEEEIKACNKLIRDGAEALGYRIISPSVNTTPYILSLSQSLPSEVFTRIMADKGFCISSGSACSNNAKGKSEGILEAMGVRADEARRAIRVSFSKDTKKEDAIELLKAFEEVKKNV